jgi:hypothetical protein
MNKTITYRGLILLCFAGVLSLFLSCKTNKITNEERVQNLAILDSLYGQDEFNIDIEVVYPFNTAATTQVASVLLRGTGDNANRIDVRGDGNYLKIQNDSIKAYLPFFGESRLSAGDYGGRNISIQIEQPLTDISKQINTEKGKLELEFRADQKGNDNDKYDIRIEIYPNQYVKVNITPVYRTFMQYDGVLESFDDEE